MVKLTLCPLNPVPTSLWVLFSVSKVQDILNALLSVAALWTRKHAQVFPFYLNAEWILTVSSFLTFFIFPLLPDFSKKYLKWTYLSQCLFTEWIDECILSTSHYLVTLWPLSFSKKCFLINLIHTFKLLSQVVSPDTL